MARSDWLADRMQEFADLKGHEVVSWSGVEMAVHEAGPCLRLVTLEMGLDVGPMTVCTYQEDDRWGLYLCAAMREQHPEREPAELPTGRIEDVTAHLDGDVLAEMELQIAGRPLLLLAGEVHAAEGGPAFTRLDESVLVFTDPAAANALTWTPHRRPLSLRHVADNTGAPSVHPAPH